MADTKIGDTITDERKPASEPLPGFKPSVPVVFCGLFPLDAAEYPQLRDSLAKLRLNDASFHFEPETSAALGFGFRCGFLGLLHLEIIQERLEREFNLELITTAPSVVYKIHMTNGEMMEMHNPVDMPDPMRIDHMEEPWIKATIIVPADYLGPILKLCEERRGVQVELNYVGTRAMLVYKLPLNEVVYDFYDRLKSVSRGYASFDYHLDGYEIGDLVKLSILVNGEPVDALSMIVHRAHAEARGRAHVRAAEGADPAPAVQDRHPGVDRRPRHRPRDAQRPAQGRAGEMLWRRHHPQAQASGQAEEGQEEDAPVRQCGDSAVGLPRRPQDGRRIALALAALQPELIQQPEEDRGRQRDEPGRLGQRPQDRRPEILRDMPLDRRLDQQQAVRVELDASDRRRAPSSTRRSWSSRAHPARRTASPGRRIERRESRQCVGSWEIERISRAAVVGCCI